jgi:pyruvate/2-oxoglutarate dehydrogenase complex dihydrolipoamide dehydrogenase (E3) component
MLATGRRPNIDDLALDAAGVKHGHLGIKVDKRLRSTNRRVYAIGDVAGGPLFTHATNFHAGVVVRSALFRLPTEVNYNLMSWVTYTDPELAQFGLTEAVARTRPLNPHPALAQPRERPRAGETRDQRLH